MSINEANAGVPLTFSKITNLKSTILETDQSYFISNQHLSLFRMEN